jgi:pentose-5-phosphate-3-epimerase
LLNKNTISNLFHKYRFFYIFIIIGFTSLIIEFFIYNILSKYKFNSEASSFIGLMTSVIFAFYLNFFFNFEIHKSKITKAFIIFVIICFFSWSFQKFLGIYFTFEEVSYEVKRLITSGLFFTIAYFLHKKFSFRESKKVGVAFYLTKSLKLKKIYNLIKNNANFIHVDIIDKSFSKSEVKNKIEMFNQIKSIWPNQEIHAHVMSKKPSRWVKKIIEYCDVIFLHYEANDDLNKLKNYIISKNKKFGLATTLKTNPKKIIQLLKKSSALLILSVDKPGFSGQNFNFKAIKYIDFFNNLAFRKNFRVCVDGGVDKNIVKILDVDDVVSNSSILGSIDPAGEIIKFKSADY